MTLQYAFGLSKLRSAINTVLNFSAEIGILGCAPSTRTTDSLCRAREINPPSVNNEHWLVDLCNRRTHHGAVPVVIDEFLQALQRRAPRYITHLCTMHKLQSIFMGGKVHKSVTKGFQLQKSTGTWTKSKRSSKLSLSISHTHSRLML